jgi:hypothetical protein
VVLRGTVQPAPSVVSRSDYPARRSPGLSSEEGEERINVGMRFRNKDYHGRRFHRRDNTLHERLLRIDQEYKWWQTMNFWRGLSNIANAFPVHLSTIQPCNTHFATIHFDKVYFPKSIFSDPSTVVVHGYDKLRNISFLILCSCEDPTVNSRDFQVAPSDDCKYILAAFKLALYHEMLELGSSVTSITRPWRKIKDWSRKRSFMIEDQITHNLGELLILTSSAELRNQFPNMSCCLH